MSPVVQFVAAAAIASAGVTVAVTPVRDATPTQFVYKIDAHDDEQVETYRLKKTFATFAECKEFAQDDFTAVLLVTLQAQLFAQLGHEVKLDNARCVEVPIE